MMIMSLLMVPFFFNFFLLKIRFSGCQFWRCCRESKIVTNRPMRLIPPLIGRACWEDSKTLVGDILRLSNGRRKSPEKSDISCIWQYAGGGLDTIKDIIWPWYNLERVEEIGTFPTIPNLSSFHNQQPAAGARKRPLVWEIDRLVVGIICRNTFTCLEWAW